jgi:hypothetical protein
MHYEHSPHLFYILFWRDSEYIKMQIDVLKLGELELFTSLSECNISYKGLWYTSVCLIQLSLML